MHARTHAQTNYYQFTLVAPLRILLKGNKTQHFDDMGLTELIKSNNLQQQSYF